MCCPVSHMDPLFVKATRTPAGSNSIYFLPFCNITEAKQTVRKPAKKCPHAWLILQSSSSDPKKMKTNWFVRKCRQPVYIKMSNSGCPPEDLQLAGTRRDSLFSVPPQVCQYAKCEGETLENCYCISERRWISSICYGSGQRGLFCIIAIDILAYTQGARAGPMGTMIPRVNLTTPGLSWLLEIFP